MSRNTVCAYTQDLCRGTCACTPTRCMQGCVSMHSDALERSRVFLGPLNVLIQTGRWVQHHFKPWLLYWGVIYTLQMLPGKCLPEYGEDWKESHHLLRRYILLGTKVDAEVRLYPSSLLSLPETPHQISPSSPKSQTDRSSCHPLNTVAYYRHPSYCGSVPTERKLYVGRKAYETGKGPRCPLVGCLFCMCEGNRISIQTHLWTDSWLQPTGLNAQ